MFNRRVIYQKTKTFFSDAISVFSSNYLLELLEDTKWENDFRTTRQQIKSEMNNVVNYFLQRISRTVLWYYTLYFVILFLLKLERYFYYKITIWNALRTNKYKAICFDYWKLELKKIETRNKCEKILIKNNFAICFLRSLTDIKTYTKTNDFNILHYR